MRPGCQVAVIYAVIHGYMNDVPVSRIQQYMSDLYSLMEGEHEDWLEKIEAGEYSADIENELKQILAGIRTERYDPARVKADQEAQHAG